MPHLRVPLLSGEKICKALKRSEKLDFRGVHADHAVFRVLGKPANISIPLHKEVSRALLSEQLKLAAIPVGEFYILLKKRVR